MEPVAKKIGVLVIVLGLLFVSSMLVGFVLLFATNTWSVPTMGNVALIPIKGVIVTQTGSWAGAVDPVFVRESIKNADEDERIKAIVLEIDSPGGSPVASDEIGQALKTTSKPTIALIREVGASGAYWVASNTDYIIANRMSITGSVGVTASYIEIAGTLRRYNATYQELHSGEYKEAGSMFGELDAQERALLQRKIDLIHEYFLEEVQQNRNLSRDATDTIRTGEIFIGSEALELGLVDELGGFDELDAYLKEITGEKPSYIYYEKQLSFLDQFSLLRSAFLPGAILPSGELQLRT